MVDHIFTQIAYKMISFWAKTLFKLHKVSGQQIESGSIHCLILAVWRLRKLCRNPCLYAE